jgi:hypothetical protein
MVEIVSNPTITFTDELDTVRQRKKKREDESVAVTERER